MSACPLQVPKGRPQRIRVGLQGCLFACPTQSYPMRVKSRRLGHGIDCMVANLQVMRSPLVFIRLLMVFVGCSVGDMVCVRVGCSRVQKLRLSMCRLLRIGCGGVFWGPLWPGHGPQKVDPETTFWETARSSLQILAHPSNRDPQL